MDTNEGRDTLPASGETAATLRVLVVEDDADLATHLQKWLGRQGYEVRVVSDGAGAVREAGASPPDVVLLDIGLPGIDGYQVAERVHREVAPTLPKVPLLIAVTGRAEEADQRRSREAGIDLHLVKPLDPDQLLRVLQRFQSIIR
jgi:two-component system OmpR family response regulator